MDEARDSNNPEPTGWEGFLAPGESILWQGMPDDGAVWSDIFWPGAVMGGVISVFALLWVVVTGLLVIGMLGEGAVLLAVWLAVFLLVGLALLALGLFLIAGPVLWDAHLRRNTWYTLTDRTAFIATAPFGKRRLVRLPLGGTQPLLEPGNPGTVWLTGTAGRGGPGTGRAHPREGFRRIAEAEAVFGLVQQARTAPD